MEKRQNVKLLSTPVFGHLVEKWICVVFNIPVTGHPKIKVRLQNFMYFFLLKWWLNIYTFASLHYKTYKVIENQYTCYFLPDLPLNFTHFHYQQVFRAKHTLLLLLTAVVQWLVRCRALAVICRKGGRKRGRTF